MKMTDFLKNNGSIILTIFRYLILLLIGMLVLRLFLNNKLEINDYKELISTILSTTGITVAIIISFLFSKLFSERNERVERKRLIDIESKKITAFRKMCHFLKSSHDFWAPFGNLKEKFDIKYKDLKLSNFDSEHIDFDKYTAFCKEVNYGELGGQAYTALREIAGNEIGLAYYDSQLRKNYSLDEISRIHDASNRIWYFFDKHRSRMVDFNTISILYQKPIKQNLKIICPDYEVEKLDNKKLQDTFDYIHESISRKLFLLTQKNIGFLGKRMNLLLVDLSVFVFIIISSVFISSFEYAECKKEFGILVLISIFIITVIDLLINVIIALRSELKIVDFYEL